MMEVLLGVCGLTRKLVKYTLNVERLLHMTHMTVANQCTDGLTMARLYVRTMVMTGNLNLLEHLALLLFLVMNQQY